MPRGRVSSAELLADKGFGTKAATLSEAAGPVWRGGAYVPGVQGVSGAALDKDGSVVVNVGSGSFTLTVSI